tara:strand:+ start:22 stop:1467 length:1446 start_codon:yes stop_codon:yes gene_type:complete
MVNIYSIKEILEASDNILKSKSKNRDILSLDDSIKEKKKEINKFVDKPLLLKNNHTNEIITTDIDKIILEAESAQLKEKVKINKSMTDANQDFLIESKINQKELIDDLYKMFGKKIKKNTLQLILELRKDIVSLTKNISSLEQNKNEAEQKNVKLKKNIEDLKNEESNLHNNLDKSINGFNKLNYEHKNLKLDLNKLKEDLLDNNKKISKSNEINNQLNNNLKRNKDSFNTLYDNHKNLKINFNIIEEDLNHKKKNINISGELNRKLENKIQTLENKLIEYKDIESNLSLKIEKLENYIFNSNTKQDKLVNQNSTLVKNNAELKTKLDSVGHIDIYLEEINQLKLKNKDLENTIEKLKSYEDNNDQNLNIIKELENKIKYYQEENIRISNQLYEANKRFDIIKNEIEVMQNQRVNLIAKINSVNDVIHSSKIVTNAFDNTLQNHKVEINNDNLKTDKLKIEKTSNSMTSLDDEIKNIFTKK